MCEVTSSFVLSIGTIFLDLRNIENYVARRNKGRNGTEGVYGSFS
jgi:hypothetical protein